MSQDGKLEECSLFPKTTYLDSCITSPTFFFFVCFSNLSNLIAPSCVYRGTTFSHQPVLLYPHQVHRLKQRELHCMNFPVNKLKLKYFIVPEKWQESTVKEFMEYSASIYLKENVHLSISFYFFLNLVFSVIKLSQIIWLSLNYVDVTDIESSIYISKINSPHISQWLYAIYKAKYHGVEWEDKGPIFFSKARTPGWDGYAMACIHYLSYGFDHASSYPYDLWAWYLFSGRKLQSSHLWNEGNRLGHWFLNLNGYELIWIIIKRIDAQALKILIK